MISVEGVSVRRNSGKPKMLVRGRRRKAVKNCLKQLKNVFNQDWYENRRAALNNYDAYLILGASNSAASKAMVTIQAALEKALAAKS